MTAPIPNTDSLASRYPGYDVFSEDTHSSRSQVWHYLRAILIVAEVTLRHMFVDMFVVFVVIVQPLIIALLALWMLDAQDGTKAIFVVIGSGMTGLWSSVLFISGNALNGERWSGTLEMLACTPTPLWVITVGKNLANVVQSLLSMILGYGLAVLLFGYRMEIQQPLLFTGSLVVGMFAFICFGLLIAPIFIANRAVQQWQNAMEFPVYILGGFLFPIALLPGWTTPISYLLAPYWTAYALQGSANGSLSTEQILLSWLIMTVLGVIYLLIAARIFGIVLTKVRIDGTLGSE